MKRFALVILIAHLISSLAFAGTFPVQGGGTTNASDLSSGTLPVARIGDNTLPVAKLIDNTTALVARFWTGAGDYLLADGTRATPTGTGTVVGPATSTEDNFVLWGADNVTLKNSSVSSVNPSFSTINVTGANALNLGTAGSLQGSIRYKSAGNANNYFPIVANAAFTDNVGWVLPAGAPSDNTSNFVRVSTTGAVSYDAPAGSGTVTSVTSYDNTVLQVDNTTTTPLLTIVDNAVPAAKLRATATSPSATTAYFGDNSWKSALPDGMTATTQSDADNSTKLATTAYVDSGLSAKGAGDVTGPASSGNLAVAKFNGTGGKTLMNSGCTISADNVLTCAGFASSAADNTHYVDAVNTGALAAGSTAAGRCYFDNSLNGWMCRNSDNTVTFTVGAQVKTFSFAIDNVIASDNVLLWRVPRAITITRADCYASTDNVVGQIMECATDNAISCTTLDAWSVGSASADGTLFSDTSMTDGAVAAGAWVRWSTTSVGTTNSNKLSCTIQYRE